MASCSPTIRSTADRFKIVTEPSKNQEPSGGPRKLDRQGVALSDSVLAARKW
ncbi:other/AgaK1 protein kinase [Coprinopsis cinerea AmutBmut pab1-1]|nr:other/AgaK1 protein kinase [Coprinopsis cinerea AmutBmut pab1-1]